MNRQRTKTPSKPTLFIIASFIILGLLGIFKFPHNNNNTTTKQSSSFTSSNRMGIIHIVMFEFKEEATSEQITDVCTRMLALKEKCLHPSTNTPYVKSAIGGRENSPEGISGGLTHIFVEEFENEEDRKYYLEKDPAHLAFVASVGAVVKKAQVVDFTPGVF